MSAANTKERTVQQTIPGLSYVLNKHREICVDNFHIMANKFKIFDAYAGRIEALERGKPTQVMRTSEPVHLTLFTEHANVRQSVGPISADDVYPELGRMPRARVEEEVGGIAASEPAMRAIPTSAAEESATEPQHTPAPHEAPEPKIFPIAETPLMLVRGDLSFHKHA
jgi:hypothetical protein